MTLRPHWCSLIALNWAVAAEKSECCLLVNVDISCQIWKWFDNAAFDWTWTTSAYNLILRRDGTSVSPHNLYCNCLSTMERFFFFNILIWFTGIFSLTCHLFVPAASPLKSLVWGLTAKRTWIWPHSLPGLFSLSWETFCSWPCSRQAIHNLQYCLILHSGLVRRQPWKLTTDNIPMQIKLLFCFNPLSTLHFTELWLLQKLVWKLVVIPKWSCASCWNLAEKLLSFMCYVKFRIQEACIMSTVLYGSEAWTTGQKKGVKYIPPERPQKGTR